MKNLLFIPECHTNPFRENASTSKATQGRSRRVHPGCLFIVGKIPQYTFLRQLAFIGGLMLLLPTFMFSQVTGSRETSTELIADTGRMNQLLTSPPCLQGYQPNQSGPLSKLNNQGEPIPDTTFDVEKLVIESEGYPITGWLYLPRKQGRFSLILLANGGGGKVLSEWIAPILAHCGYAAFVHDKRGSGESGGNIETTTYDDYANDLVNLALFFSRHSRINASKIGVFGGSEGGRIAYLAAARSPLIQFAASYAGDITSTFDSRYYATLGWIKLKNPPDSVYRILDSLWEKSLKAWDEGNNAKIDESEKEVNKLEGKIEKILLPPSRHELLTVPALKGLLPTWNSMKNDYLSVLSTFRKRWLTIFGADDVVVPTQKCILNIQNFTKISGNKQVEIVVLPSCGHSPVNSKTNELVRIDHMLINWLHEIDF
ncbi:MAG: alpha/beta hydrolase [Bacteroidales bacterium]|nr:alpha/beta hydrolase [Bacteroidales bacterium]MDD3664530.1 alpha/beta hydrolase [Bacteroidales bacterium]